MKREWVRLCSGCGMLLVLSLCSVSWAQTEPSTSSGGTSSGATSSGVPGSPSGQGDTLSISPQASWRNAPRRYVVQPGDTLWDISRRYLGSPWYWPKLWTRNPQIQNPHWIFPGNLILFSTAGEVAVTPKEPKQKSWEDISKSGDDAIKSTDISVGGKIVSVQNLGLEGQTILDRRESFIDAKGLKESGTVLRTSDARTFLSSGDPLFLSFKDLRNVRTGEQYSIYRKVTPINDPLTNRLTGHMIQLTGILQITAVEKRWARGTIVEAFREVQRGDLVGRYIHHKVQVKIRRNEALVRGHVFRATSSVSIAGQFFQVFINRGRRHGVRSGNVFSVYRRGGIFRDHMPVSQRNRRFAREFVGRAVVIEVRRDTCVAVVTQSVSEIHDGDEVETSLSD